MYKKSYPIHICNKLFILAFFLSLHGTILAQSEFEQKIASLGYDVTEVNDWSDSTDIILPMPHVAYVNVTGIKTFPTKASVKGKAWVELWDANGNYFKKKAIIETQGKSSNLYPKRNFKAGFCLDDWEGEETPNITFGNWVDQDAFHFKAFYLDYFRGTGIMGYRIYDQLTIGRGEYGRLWERANLSKPDVNALCHPDAFPCMVYLNGEFYGLYCWQLKKHRKNMNQKKNTAEHIHLDGMSTYSRLYNGDINWKILEVRNPKNLYAMDGTIYDHDTPTELMDATSEYYNLPDDDEKTKKYKENSALVKGYIQQLNRFYSEVNDMVSNKASKQEIRAYIEERFDVPSLIDYIIHNLLTNNLDGLIRNYQLFTYDGNKWFVVPYDLDATFGYHPTTFIIFPPRNYGLGNLTSRTFVNYHPMRWAELYFKQEIYDRYAYLRNNGLLNSQTISSLFENWYYSIGEENYATEWEKWNDSPCIKETISNWPWRLLSFDEYRNKEYDQAPDYDPETTYLSGQRCRVQYRLWETEADVKGVLPYQQIGSKDSIGRIEPWVREHLIYLDTWMHYSFESLPSSYTLSVSSVGWATVCVPFSFVVPQGMELYTIEGLEPDGSLLLSSVDVPQANKPYLVKAAQGEYLITGFTEEADENQDDYLVNGILQGCYAEKYVPMGDYVLQNHNGHVAFYPVLQSGTVKIAPNKAFILSVNGSAVSMPFIDLFDDDSVVQAEYSSTLVNVCDAYGISSDRLRRGINIVTYSNGKKMKIIVK